MHSMHLSQNIGRHDIMLSAWTGQFSSLGIAPDTYIGIIEMLLGQLHVHGTSHLAARILQLRPSRQTLHFPQDELHDSLVP